MLKRTLLVLLLSTAVSAAAQAADNLAVNLAGIGSKSCGYWLSGQAHKSEGTVWIFGFWSGLNYVAVASDQNQSKAKDDAMIAAVERLCRQEPSRVLAEAAWSAYIELNKN